MGKKSKRLQQLVRIWKAILPVLLIINMILAIIVGDDLAVVAWVMAILLSLS